MMNEEKKLQVKDLTISFRTINGKVQAVRDISFDLYKGETLAIVGESGSGKSVTSKAILGISAGNAIVENGEILYDGKDLLKITEEDFHAIRGDKIAMVFQDPLSSLNPIMRIGKQLTEAMLLKNKANRKESRKKLDESMKRIETDVKTVGMSGVSGDFDFRQLVKEQSKFELPYSNAHACAVAANKACDDLLLSIDKEVDIDFAGDCAELIEYAQNSVDRFVVKDGEAMKSLCARLKAESKLLAKERRKKNNKKLDVTIDTSALKEITEGINALLDEALAQDVPHFFHYACRTMLEKQPLEDLSAAQLNEITRDSADCDIMTKFKSQVQGILEYSSGRSVEAMGKAVAQLDAAAEAFSGQMPAEADAKKLWTETSKAVEDAIDPYETVKDSAAYTFKVSLQNALSTYYDGIKRNASEEKRFARQTARYEAKVARGRTPNGKVAPLSLVDLDMAQDAIVHILSNMKQQFGERTERVKGFDFKDRAEKYVTWMRDTAMGENHILSKSVAKDNAIRIMEQVGISEARKRYRQYPFEFSGGMRQRIVIAISLTANPDILICDEPTTALDVTIQAQILELINELKKKRDLSVIFITHDLGVVANMADRIAVMYAGKIVEYGTAEDVFYSPAHPYTWALLASVPDLDSKGKTLEAIPGTPPNMIYPPVGDAFAARNKYAMDIDFEMQPPMFKISDTHYAATWLLHPDAPKVEMPEIVKDRIARMHRKAGEE